VLSFRRKRTCFRPSESFTSGGFPKEAEGSELVPFLREDAGPPPEVKLSEGRKQVQKARPSGDALPSGSFTSGASFGKTQLAGNTWNTSVIRRKRIHDGDPRSPFKRLPEVGDWLCQSPPQVTIPSPLPSAPLCPSSRRTSFGGRRVTV
jgi:hypothetical protein